MCDDRADGGALPAASGGNRCGSGGALDQLPLLTEDERHQLLVEWNDTRAEYPADLLHQLFEEQVRRTPEVVAVVFEDQQLTYRELNARRSTGSASADLGVGPEMLVGICLERSLEMVVGLLGFSRRGGRMSHWTRIPRRATCVHARGARPRLVLTQRRLEAVLPRTPGCGALPGPAPRSADMSGSLNRPDSKERLCLASRTTWPTSSTLPDRPACPRGFKSATAPWSTS